MMRERKLSRARSLQRMPHQAGWAAKLWQTSRPSGFLGSGLAGLLYLAQHPADFHMILLVGALTGLGVARGITQAYNFFVEPMCRLLHTGIQVAKVLLYHRAGLISARRRKTLITHLVEADISGMVNQTQKGLG